MTCWQRFKTWWVATVLRPPITIRNAEGLPFSNAEVDLAMGASARDLVETWGLETALALVRTYGMEIELKGACFTLHSVHNEIVIRRYAAFLARHGVD